MLDAPTSSTATSTSNPIAEPSFVRLPTAATPPNSGAIPMLFEHSRRSAWGRAVCVWNRDGRRAFQFEDGKLRIIAQTHSHLLVRARVGTSEAISVARDLRAAAGISMAQRERAATGQAPLVDVIQQVALFRDVYPEGFEDAKWKKDVRGIEVKRALKRHRNPAMALAQEKLSITELNRLIEMMSGSEILERIREVLKATDLVTKKDVSCFDNLTVSEGVAVATSLRNLLVGEGHLDALMKRYIHTLTRMTGRAPRWQLATALPALIEPQSFPWVRPSAIREQAKSLAPHLKLANAACGRAYAQVCQLVRVVADKLISEGMTPRDLMDVTDFTWNTLRPASRKHLAELLASRRHPKSKKETSKTELKEVNAA